ncbi:MAG: response regulator [bacterium]
MKDPVVVLLVEDEEAHTAIVRRYFEECRIPNLVMHVADGQDALDYLYHRNGFSDPAVSPRPGIILLDLRLPKLDGMEVLKTIKADRKRCSIPVVILTTSTSEEAKSEALASHASAFMSKSDLFYSRSDEMMEVFCKLITGSCIDSSK